MVVSALGYFVDIYDLILFSIVRVPSLRALEVTQGALLSQGILLLNMQMVGMLLGGILWGMIGDKRGRLSVLFGSILMYSLANFANAAVQSVEAYAVWRLIAGIGLAGELGAGITLVSEALPQKTRGYGTTLVASFGICGAILAVAVAQYFDWRMAYVIGGVLGIALLVMRISVYESHLFEKVKKSSVSRGSLLALFSTWPRARKYVSGILIGVPVWFVIGILITFSPEFAQALGISGEVSAATAVLACYVGTSAGGFASGFLSQWMRSRKKVVGIFLALTFALTLGFLSARGASPSVFYLLSGALGFATGYWALFVTIGAEQFGTNLRATAATTTPNFVRGSVVPLTLAFESLRAHEGILAAGFWVGVSVMVIAGVSLLTIEETFHKDLGFVEL